jgi:hypothetical protein
MPLKQCATRRLGLHAYARYGNRGAAHQQRLRVTSTSEDRSTLPRFCFCIIDVDAMMGG